MKTSKLIFLGKIFAIAIIVLGIIHDIATFSPLIKGGLACLNPGNFKAMTYMSLICGTSFVLSGIVLVMLLNKFEELPSLKSTILVVGVFLAISGIFSIVFMTNNLFAWIALFLNMGMFLIVVGLKVTAE